MDSNVMHINDLPQPYSTLTRPQRGLISSLYHYSTHCLHFFNTNSILMSSLSNCTVCTNESVWSSLFPNNFNSSIRKMFIITLNPSQDHNLLLIFSTPMLMESCRKQEALENASSSNKWLPTSRLMMITLLLCLHTINKKNLFTVLSYFKHLQTLDNPAMWYHVICFPVITQSQRQNVDCFSQRAVSWNSQ